MSKKPYNHLESAALPFGFLCVIYALPSTQLLASPLKLDQYIFIFLCPITIGFFRSFITSIKNNNKTLMSASSVMNWVLIGISIGYGFLSLVILFHWQQSPDIEHLESLFVILGVATAIAESARRLSIKNLTSQKNG